jgi:hypothetical protein
MTRSLTRRAAAFAAGVVAVLSVGAAPAQAQSPIRLGLAGGLAMPMGDVADTHESGYNGTVTLAVNAPLLPVGLRIDGMFNELKAQDDGLLGGAAPDLRVSSVNANLTYNILPLPIARVYLIGGAGYYRTELKDSGVDTETKVGYNGGAGLRFGTGRAQLFVEARYHQIRLDDDAKIEIVPITIGFLF